MDGSNGILDIGKEEEVKMMKDRLIDGKTLLVDLLVFQKIKIVKKLNKFDFIGVMKKK